ncbi:MAG TPA: DNA polymerase Y family protein [Aromatoleum sp.]|uniref:Y-family DNA polymerase n=1 Tax=Aromatoleum sp. TaxID=2307007 RepID=UPI002B48BF4D|nr:DNA polymerase Y family protein [Aromatoleum sp.]HJV25320.1 DNA polymerase Y family protein [Aromatoleum sp.]
MLWLALRFPRLAVETLSLPPPAVALHRGRVAVADEAATVAGVRSGMRLAGALGLVPGLIGRERDLAGETDALHRLACAAGEFTPQVSIASPDELLLEIGGCLRLFGGLPPLLARIAASYAEQGFARQWGLAPTPLAAQWLARCAPVDGPPPALVDDAKLRAAVAPLPVGVLAVPERTAGRLTTLGVWRLADLMVLPRAGLAHRFGPELPGLLARALGEVPDLRPPFVFPEHFRDGLELPARVEDAARLLFAASRLLAALAGWLAVRCAGIQSCHLMLFHEGRPPSRVELGFASPTRDPERLQRVLRERLDRLELVAPVVSLGLEAPEPHALPGTNAVLFGHGGTTRLAPVVERLRARLGPEAVHGLTAVADHRPEQASRPVAEPAAARSSEAPSGPRPLWLLPEPRPLAEENGAPCHEGRLRLLTRAERIESGWWDGGEGLGDVQRDYFVALSPQGEWLWIFRDGQSWWLHGLFA